MYNVIDEVENLDFDTPEITTLGHVAAWAEDIKVKVHALLNHRQGPKEIPNFLQRNVTLSWHKDPLLTYI